MNSVDSASAHRFSVAPMMELTDRHYRFFARLLSRKALLFTEMVTAKAIIHGDRNYLLGFNPEENPLALQLGGSDPSELAAAAKIGEQYGYDEINLNVGCPSDRVQSGRFGACLMAEPELVAGCISAMQDSVAVPVTVKCRIGIDREDRYEPFEEFVATVAATGCNRFYVHARKAWLDGLSPRENREIPPLRYDYVYRLKETIANLDICINGGIADWPAVLQHLRRVDGVMLGRAAYYQPELLMQVDELVYGHLETGADLLTGRDKSPACSDTNSDVKPDSKPDTETVVELKKGSENGVEIGMENGADTNLSPYPSINLKQAFEFKAHAARAYAEYMQTEMSRGVPLTAMSRHLIGFFQQQRGARLWRRTLSTIDRNNTDPTTLVDQALAAVEPNAGDDADSRLAGSAAPVSTLGAQPDSRHIATDQVARN